MTRRSSRPSSYPNVPSDINVEDPFLSPTTPTSGLDWDPSFLYADTSSSTSHSQSHSYHSAPSNSHMEAPVRSPTTILSPSPLQSPIPTNPTRERMQQTKPMAQMTRDTISRPPPSSFTFQSQTFPFQSHPGNPDPGTRIPSVPRLSSSSHSVRRSSRRSSIESLVDDEKDRESDVALPRPRPPFMIGPDRRDSGSSVGSSASSTNSVYRASAAAASNSNLNNNAVTGASIPRNSSAASFRAPFLAPSSRPTSTAWVPPTPSYAGSPTASTAALGLPKSKPLAKSTRLAGKLAKTDKPWLLAKKDTRTRLSWWSTLFCLLLGLAGAAIICWHTMATVQLIPQNKLCNVLNENFDTLDRKLWNLDIELGGFGNGEFQMTTSDPANIYTQNGQLYIMPTLTSDIMPQAQIFDGGNYTLKDCTSSNKTACSVSSNAKNNFVINPVRSARLNTKGTAGIAFGKVEVRAKLPKGDWLWPAIWMLPADDSKYGPWPIGGEIDIMEARGNSAAYEGQGNNFVRSSMNYGPMNALVRTLTGWWSQKRSNYADGFHTYGLEWDKKFMRFYVDSRLEAMLNLQVGNGWWNRAGFPATAKNGSAEVVVQNIYAQKGGSLNAPFDQPFYLVLDLAVGGTSGWFPDKLGNKPWYDGSFTAMSDFAHAQSQWYSTWPTNPDERAFRIDYARMWKYC